MSGVRDDGGGAGRRSPPALAVLLALLLPVGAGAQSSSLPPLTPSQEERLREHVERDEAAVFTGDAEAGRRLPLAAQMQPIPGFLMMELPGLRILRSVRLAQGFALTEADSRIVVRVFK